MMWSMQPRFSAIGMSVTVRAYDAVLTVLEEIGFKSRALIILNYIL